MRILFVDHAYHKATKSSAFFVELLRRSFEVDVFRYDRCYRVAIPRERIAWAEERFARWKKDETFVLDFFATSSDLRTCISPWRPKALVHFLFFLVEGMLMRLVSSLSAPCSCRNVAAVRPEVVRSALEGLVR